MCVCVCVRHRIARDSKRNQVLNAEAHGARIGTCNIRSLPCRASRSLFVDPPQVLSYGSDSCSEVPGQGFVLFVG